MIRLAIVLTLALVVPAGAARVSVSRLERQAWECALWTRARIGTSVSPFGYRLVPRRNGTVDVQSWGWGDEIATFQRCLREKGNVF